jgi:hypothetical protein
MGKGSNKQQVVVADEEGCGETCSVLGVTNSRPIGFQVEHRPVTHGATRMRMLELAPSLG